MFAIPNVEEVQTLKNVLLEQRRLRQEQHVNAAGNDGRTPLSLAAENGHKDLVKYFINQKVNINIRNCDGMTPLSLAAEYGYDDLAIYLTEHGAKR